MKVLWHILRDAAREWVDDKAPQHGAALAFYSILSIGPLLIVILSISTLFYGQEAAQGQLLRQIDGLVGHDGAAVIQGILAASAEKKATGIVATAISFATLLIGATGVFGQLQTALNAMWNVPLRKKKRGVVGIIRARFWSFALVLGIGFLLLISLVVSTVLAAMGQITLGLMHGIETLMHVVNVLVSFGIVTALFAFLFKYLPDVKVHWRDVWVGAAVTSLLFTVGKSLIGLYLGHSALNSTYGAAGSLMALLAWIYYSSQILFFGAEITQMVARRNKRAD